MKKLLLVCGALFAGVCGSATAQTFNISSTGVPGSYASLTSALDQLTTGVTGTVEFVFLDEGPFQEGRMIINEAKGPATVVIRPATPNMYPKLIVDAGTSDGVLYLRKWGGPLTIRNLIIMPKVGVTGMQAAVKTDNISVLDYVTDRRTSITLQNIVVTGNDGNDNPAGSINGKTPPNVTGPNYTTFRDEGFEIAGGGAPVYPRNIYLYGCVATGLNGNQRSNGLRALGNGDGGSEIVIGPGCAFTYNNTINPTDLPLPDPAPDDSGLQSGNNNSGIVVRIEGTQDRPVIVANNNYNGVFQTGTTPGFSSIRWLISANNSGAGFQSRTVSTNKIFQNVTFANNGRHSWTGGNAATPVYSSIDTASNVIFAGNGLAAPTQNLIEAKTDVPDVQGGGVFTISDSAIVLAGPYKLDTSVFDGDGLEDESPSNIVRTNIISSDPQFISLDPANPNFAVVSNSTYGTAGPGGTPLVGGGRMATSSISDWQIF